MVCVANAEPLIVEGDLYQLGSKPVIKHSVSAMVHLKTVDTSVIKMELKHGRKLSPSPSHIFWPG